MSAHALACRPRSGDRFGHVRSLSLLRTGGKESLVNGITNQSSLSLKQRDVYLMGLKNWLFTVCLQSRLRPLLARARRPRRLAATSQGR
jgi:hypothetical protein